MDNLKLYSKEYYASHYGREFQDPKYYHLLSLFWKEAIFDRQHLQHLNPNLHILDYGCGIGQVSAALPNVTFFDYSKFAVEFLRNQGKKAYGRVEDIPIKNFDYLLSSHSLEHSPTPSEELKSFHRYLKPGGKLILILPVEVDLKPHLLPDSNQHFQCWTFQTITNFLWHCGWKPVHQAKIYGPFLLGALGSIMSPSQAAKIVCKINLIKKNYPSMLTIAESID